jgi:DNA-3-methyladenine glycosylase I
MPIGLSVELPRSDEEYFERMTKAIFRAGLNRTVIEKKWPNFRRAFVDFSLQNVSNYSGRDVRTLMEDSGIVRNERKIAATVYNAGEFLELQKEFGSFKKYMDSFGSDEKRLQNDLQERFQQLGASTARMFLWSIGYPLTPNPQEEKWLASHRQQATNLSEHENVSW